MRSVFCLVCAVVMTGLAGCGRNAAHYLQQGNEFRREGKLVEASIQYRKAIQKNPNLGEAYLQLGVSELEQNKGLEGFSALKRAVELMPESIEVKARLADFALAAYQLDRKSQAMYDLLLDLSEELLEKDPESFDGLRIKGVLALFNNQPTEAVAYFRKANVIRPLEKYVVLPYIEALIKNGQAEAAEELARLYIEHDPTSPEVYVLLYSYYVSADRLRDGEAILRMQASNNPGEARHVINLAAHYERIQDQEAARSTLQNLAGNPAEYPDAFLAVGAFYAQAQNWEDAVKYYEQGRDADPARRNEYLRRIATIRIAQGSRAEARTLLEEILVKNPDDDLARFMRANLMLLEGNADSVRKAIPEYEGLRKKRPADTTLRINLGKAYLAVNDLDAAREVLLEASRMDASSPEPRFLLASISLRQRNSRQALLHIEEVLERTPQAPDAELMRAMLLMDLGQYEQAAAGLDRLALRFPASRDVKIQQGLLAILQKRFGEAERILSKLVDSGDSDLRAIEGLARLYSTQSQFDKALGVLESAVQSSPHSAGLLRLHALTAARAGRYDAAIEDYRRLLNNDADSAVLLSGLGDVYRLQGDLEAALRECTKARALDPNLLLAGLCVAAALDEAGRGTEAIAAYRDILKVYPGNAVARNNLAFALAQTNGNLDEAMELARDVVRERPAYSDGQDTLGWIYLKKGMIDSALQIFGSLVRDHPDHPSYHHHLGEALASKRDFQGAREALFMALAKDPSEAGVREIRELLGKIEGL